MSERVMIDGMQHPVTAAVRVRRRRRTTTLTPHPNRRAAEAYHPPILSLTNSMLHAYVVLCVWHRKAIYHAVHAYCFNPYLYVQIRQLWVRFIRCILHPSVLSRLTSLP